MALVRAMPAARLKVVGPLAAAGALPLTLTTLRMRPQRCRCMCGRTSWLKRMAACSFRSRSAFKTARLISRNGLRAEEPALLTRMSTFFPASEIAANARSMAAGSDTSHAIAGDAARPTSRRQLRDASHR